MKRILALLLVVSLTLALASCIQSEIGNDRHPANDDSPDVEPIVSSGTEDTEPNELQSVPDLTQVSTAEEAITNIAVDTMKCLYNSENILISPVSISMALGLTSGGAEGETYAQFEKFLGRGVPLDKMNDFYRAYTERLDDSESVDIEVANSVWLRRDAVTLNKGFVNFADSYYDAEIYREAFDNSTVKKINSWVEDSTDGMIKKIIDEIDHDTMMYLINALSFEANWQKEYDDTTDYFKFTNSKGETETVTGMSSTEAVYLQDESTTGFIKNYKGGEYGFAVLLPNEDVDIDTYVDTLSGEKITALLSNAENVRVKTMLPKFKFEYEAKLKNTLKALGFTIPFTSEADFSGIGECTEGELYVDDVIHKTYIEVAEKGTKAAAVTAVIMKAESAVVEPDDIKRVTVNRPFVFAIIDNSNNLPLFLGTVLSVK